MKVANQPASSAVDWRAQLEQFAGLALQGLPAMLLPGQKAFCQTATRAADGLTPIGQSNRYSAMTLIGLTMQEPLGRRAAFGCDALWRHLLDWATDGASLGDAGLVLWALSLQKSRPADAVIGSILQRADAVLREPGAIGSMPLGWLLTGLSLAIEADLGGKDLGALTHRVHDRLVGLRHQKSGFFPIVPGSLSRRPIKRRTLTKLGSFASQVYPTIGLAQYGRVFGRSESLDLAEHTADQLCRWQGREGQWWWIYDVRSGEPVIRYPVYGVHQDAMGPMALLAVSLAGRAKAAYEVALSKSLTWLHRHPELSDANLIDHDRGVVWRAIQRDPPRTTGDYGLGRGERCRMGWAAFTGRADRREFSRGYVCDECRPYHLGWILVADAMARGLTE